MDIKKLIYVIPLLVFLLLGIFFWKQLGKNSHEIPSALLDKPVPEWIATDLLTGEKISTRESLIGRVTLVNIWATWCVPCAQEHESLLYIQQHFPVPILGINYKDDLGKAGEWLKYKGNPYYMSWVDPDGKLGIEWGITGVPETFLVDTQGIIRMRYSGPITREIFEKRFMPMIASLYSE